MLKHGVQWLSTLNYIECKWTCKDSFKVPELRKGLKKWQGWLKFCIWYGQLSNFDFISVIDLYLENLCSVKICGESAHVTQGQFSFNKIFRWSTHFLLAVFQSLTFFASAIFRLLTLLAQETFRSWTDFQPMNYFCIRG